ncbi:MAG: YgiT-type zinc finger protein [Salinibacter sp.]|uniref:YgiT-type zinc finger protein n=1 Tax=Salinibacter sp. TaxID=2065818 RepID=UPI0035D4A9BD
MVSSASTSEGMQCMHCPTGTYEEGTTTMTLERGDTTLVVKHVPAYVCSHCGDAILPEHVSRGLDDAMDAAEAAGGTTVRDYDPEKIAV